MTFTTDLLHSTSKVFIEAMPIAHLHLALVSQDRDRNHRDLCFLKKEVRGIMFVVERKGFVL
ncbi:hypothetical protein HYALB_00011134 [Hymenoscyphus albidus]|uniref:Uncharacterized protein n=1 Tax=Hymenoscyphus albidus TaxID=595503 RepID=A0A9N9LM20_9HELO|nr:hypothetical protein HYALB_00011134 [Hymenoscyphus albidus]